MYNQKKKQKNTADKQFQDQVKQIRNYLAEGKLIVQRAISQDDYLEAIQVFNKAIIKSSSAQLANSYLLFYYRGLCYLNSKQLQKAERDLIQAISLSDQKIRVQIYNTLGRCKVEMSEEDQSYLEQAIKCYEKAIQYSKSTDGESFYRLAQIYRKLKSNDEAIKNYTSSLKFLKQSQHFQVYTDRGFCYREKKQIQKSIDDFLKAAELKKEQPSTFFNLGVNYLAICQYQAGSEKFDNAIQLNPSNPQYKNFKGLALYLSGHYESSVLNYQNALKLYHEKGVSSSQVSDCWYNLGNSFLYLKKEREALQAFETALNYEISNEKKLKIYYSEGLAYERLKHLEAINKFQQSLSLMGDDKQNQLYLSALYHLSLNEYFHKKYAEAVRDIEKLINEGCKDSCIFELRGKVYLQDEKYQLALKDFEVVLSIQHNYPQIYYYLGMAKSNLTLIDSAIADFFKAIDLGSKNIYLMNGLSYAYLKADRPDKALVYVNSALKKIPKNEDFLIQRSMVYLAIGENHKGIQDLKEALEINPKNPFIYYRRGLSYYKNKQFQLAIADLKKSLDYQPNEQIQPDIYYLIGVSYANIEDFQSAVQPFTKAISFKRTPKYFHERAKCYILLDKNRQALEDLNQVILQQPENAFAYFRRALALKALKLYQQAAENFMKARQLKPEDPKLILNKKQIYEIKFRKLCEPGEQL